ncbi:unnamed protein product [Gongylonema pulchrum]|uniref:Transposase n=1 Tax=Gongylonema pulchrum TaxID=637853 RepID=A0A183DMP7_9BILA|nr:unnamed protein product [Gongylonema pulchrum]
MTPQTVIEVIVTDLPTDAVRLLATLIDRSCSVDELSGNFATATKQFNKFKKEFVRIQEAMEPFFQPKNNSPVVLFSRQSSSGYYKLLL